jgi:hypothetical protein
LNEGDAEELSLRVDQNRQHLKAWLPWLDGAQDGSDQLKFIQRRSEGAAAPARMGLSFRLVQKQMVIDPLMLLEHWIVD